jgi:molybdopterin molybdotransferase
MLSVKEARERILAAFQPVESQTIPLECTGGRVLSSDITSRTDIPPFNNSAVDGFAFRSEDSVPNQTLVVVSDIRAGTYSNIVIQRGECARIMTGATMPSGADTVIMVEDTDFNDLGPGQPAPEKVLIRCAVLPGENIRRRGEDLKEGEIVLTRGTRVRAQEMGLLAMLGVANVPVFRRPRLGLLSSGDELLSVDEELVPGKIHESNSYSLGALAEATGAVLVKLGVAADDKDDIHSKMQKAVKEKVDIIVSSAGVSVGAFDYVKAVVEDKGELNFWKVNMRPGKPIVFGKYYDIPFLGLPGNPVSAFIGFKVFVEPSLEKLSGLADKPHPKRKAILSHLIESDGRESYLRAEVKEEDGRLVAHLIGHQGSGNFFSLVRANALLIVPSGVKSLPANSEVEIWPIE